MTPLSVACSAQAIKNPDDVQHLGGTSLAVLQLTSIQAICSEGPLRVLSPQLTSVLFTGFLRCGPGFNCSTCRESDEPEQANPLVLDVFGTLCSLPKHCTKDKPGRSQSRRNPVRLPAALIQIPGAQARNHVQGDGDPAC